MHQNGQVFELRTRASDGEALWAYRYREAGRESRRIQRGGFSSQPDAAKALAAALQRVRQRNAQGPTPTLGEVVTEYLDQH